MLQIKNQQNKKDPDLGPAAWKLINHIEIFWECPKMNLRANESLENRVINIPSSAHLG